VARQPGGISKLACRAGNMLHRAMTNTALTHQIAAQREIILKAIRANSDHDVDLIAVSKRQPDERLQAALDCGHRVFGENRVQEAQAHWGHRRDIDGLRLHLIGPLQSNKSEDAVALFDVIQTVDRPKIVRTLAEAAEKLGRHPDLFIQVNTGEEDQKSGVSPGETDRLVELVRETYPGRLLGLMCIPPVEEPAGPHFALLSKLAGENGLNALSMGMSADYELACQYGATHVRVGSAFFGERDS
jgi:PLP dependent protein